eukprot:CAMPEP_0168728698 /NCGR_PEP_ID=MMETSP0724-20121128/5818_1 /TAXON_ID=265536 /ORGANISM="Amphiprora sp., Strain CCMP467" /LENGTH=302 /DNA_ID=CAMNT_0008775551 /DNA_START=130 /DNA_END=1038 /DNA_ORIENTATION=-
MKTLVVHRTIEAMRLARRAIDAKYKVGFVPTMGALHEGHLSLMRQAASENDVVVASIFVNPTQFGPNEDLDKYPRTWERDNARLKETNAVDILFAPEQMYGDNHIMYVDPTGSYFDHLPEAKVRPGHFRGVATIVTKLFNIVRPDNAYFGQKDAAQCVLIRKLVQDLSMDTNVVIGETVRESDGLAMSSRNAYLSAQERPVANILFSSLKAARDLHLDTLQQQRNDNSPTLTVSQLRDIVRSVLESEPLVKEIQYIAIDDYDTMEPLPDDWAVTSEKDIIVSLACQVGAVRLIDNMVLQAPA